MEERDDKEESLSARYLRIQERIGAAAKRAGRDPSTIQLLAVSKKQTVAAIRELYDLGHRDFGENYVGELVEKAKELQSQGCIGIRWHFIGHLQTNKVKALIPHVSSVHSVDSERVARELARRWRPRTFSGEGRLPVFIEINISNEASKSGVPVDGAVDLARWIGLQAPNLALLGMMGIPAPSHDPARLQKGFAWLRELERSCRPFSGGMLSMGMSGDFELAIAEGATHVRIGTALFGPRH